MEWLIRPSTDPDGKLAYSTIKLTVTREVAGGLTAPGERHEGAEFCSLIAVFAMLLARYGGQDDISFGLLADGEQHGETELASPPILRLNLSGAASPADVLRRSHQALREQHPGLDLERTPPPRVAFAADDGDPDLVLGFRLGSDGSLIGELKYRATSCSQASMERMAAHFVGLAEQAAANPQAALACYDLLTSEERDQILTLWNQTATPRPRVCVHELIAGQAATTPDATAVIARSLRLTYAQLDQRANHLAHHLVTLGVKPESPVGVCLRRDADLIVTLLAVLKAGGAYVPLDPGHPAERLRFLIKDTGASVAIVEHAAGSPLADSGARLVPLDQAGPGYAADPPRVRVSPGNLLYVLYTSGSTGQPKGVLVTHQGMVNRIFWARTHHGLGPSDRVLQKTPMTFDAAGWELLAPLALGGTVIMAEHGVERDPAAMVRAVIRDGATILQVVPSMLRLVVDEPEFAACTSLRALFSGGEPLTDELCARVRERLGADLYNLYGLTECTIDSTCWHYRPGESAAIGALLDNVRAYVLDRDGNPVPAEIPGELYIGGAGLARGYIGQPGLTAARFVPCPFGGQAGDRLYRTGDRARWRHDGQLQFLGRIDDQVKISGVRVEPGEIEAVLSERPDITGVAVIAQADSHGDQRLIAYVQPADADTGALAELAAMRLPRAMVPSAFVPLAQLPRTSSGKIDRRALPDPGTAARPGGPPFVPPRTPTERRIARVIGEVLGRAQIGVHDDFFQLGGRSLLAIRAAARLRAALNADITARLLFAGPTVAELARFADAAGTATAAAITPVSRQKPLPASSGQRRLWFLDKLRPGGVDYLVTVALRLRGPLDVPALADALRHLVARHEALRTRCVLLGDDLVQMIDPPGSAPLVRTVLGDRDLAGFVDELSRRPFRIADEAPFRSYLVQIGDGDNVLVLSLHHIACDGWSMNVIARELRELYAAACTGQPAAVAPLPVQFADFAAWQQDWLNGDDAAAQLAHWRDRLDGLVPLEMPTDRARASRRDAGGAVVRFQVPADLARAVSGAGQREAATPFMTMLTVFEILLARRTGRRDIAVGTTVAARTRPEIEDLIGFFMNSVVLRSVLPEGGTFAELLCQVRDSALGAFAHQDLPFDWLVDKLHPIRDPARNPLFQVLFEMEDAGRPPFSLPGVTAEPLAVGWLEAKLDLIMQLAGQDDGSYSGELQYATALFSQPTAERLVADYLRLMEQIAAKPDDLIELAGPAAATDADEIRPADYLMSAPDYVEPSTTAERAVAGMWSEVLDVERIGANDDFFELGGHSLLAVQVQMRIRDELDIELPLRMLFDTPVLSDLAREVEEAIRADTARLL